MREEYAVTQLRHCATSRKIAGSIPDGVIVIFHWHNPSGRTMTLGSTQPLTEMSTRNISWGVKAASAYGWQPYHLHVPTVLKSGSLSLLEHSGPVQACNGIANNMRTKYILITDVFSNFIYQIHKILPTLYRWTLQIFFPRKDLRLVPKVLRFIHAHFQQNFIPQ